MRHSKMYISRKKIIFWNAEFSEELVVGSQVGYSDDLNKYITMPLCDL